MLAGTPSTTPSKDCPFFIMFNEPATPFDGRFARVPDEVESNGYPIYRSPQGWEVRYADSPEDNIRGFWRFVDPSGTLGEFHSTERQYQVYPISGEQWRYFFGR